VPTHIEIDLAAGSAVWRSLMGEERISLAARETPRGALFEFARSVLGIRIACGAGPCDRGLPVRQFPQHLGHHRESGRIAILMLEVGEIGRHEIEALSEPIATSFVISALLDRKACPSAA